MVYVKFVLITGSVATVGQLYLLTLEADDCGSGRLLASTKAEVANKEQMLSAIDAASVRLRRALGESDPQSPASSPHPRSDSSSNTNLEAFSAILPPNPA